MLLVNAQSTNTVCDIDKQRAWIQSLMSEQGISINKNDYIFYCTGHHGIIWSLIVSDSSEIHLYNGTTRDLIDYANQDIPDTLSFIKNNIKTICWGIDSLTNNAHLLTPLKNRVYNPIYYELDIIKDGNLSFCYNDAKVFYNGADSINFQNKLYHFPSLPSRAGCAIFPMAFLCNQFQADHKSSIHSPHNVFV